MADGDRVRLTVRQVELARELGVPAAFRNGLGMDFVLVPPGTFEMGSAPTEPDRHLSELRHVVTISRPFYLQRTPLTRAGMRTLNARTQGDDSALTPRTDDRKPMTGLGYEAALDVARRATDLDPKRDYRLPTEAEWEYACRAGTRTAYRFGDEIQPEHACYRRSEGDPSEPADVAGYAPSNWGLYDMHGNVQEWCADWFASYPSGARTDPTGPKRPELFDLHVVRGGCWRLGPAFCRSASRMGSVDGERDGCAWVGLRLVSPLE